MPEIIGYARCSKKEQNIGSQIKKLEDIGCTKIFYEKRSAVEKKGESILERPELKSCLASLKKGDVFVATAIDRVTRQVPELFKFTSVLEGVGADLKFLQYNIDTTTPMGKLFFYFLAIFAEMERNFIIERTNSGLEAARARGMLGGRPAKLTFKEKEMLFFLYKEGKYKRKELCEKFNIKETAFHKYLNEIQDAELEKKMKNTVIPEIKQLQSTSLENLIVTFKQTSLF